MSYTEMMIVRPNGDVEPYKQLRNSWGWAPRIWQPIFDHGFHPKPKHEWGKEYESPLGMPKADLSRFWALHLDARLPRWMRRTFALTFDTAVLPREEFGRTAADVETFDTYYRVHATSLGTPENHLPVVVANLRWLALSPEHADVRAVVFSGTSVNPTWGRKSMPEGVSEENATESRPWNIDKDGGDLLSTMVPADDAGDILAHSQPI